MQLNTGFPREMEKSVFYLIHTPGGKSNWDLVENRILNLEIA